MKNTILLFFFVLLFLVSCKKKSNLPHYGHAVIPGSYINQLGEEVDSTRFKDNVVVVDFVFTHCASICPKMAKQMKRVQDEYGSSDELYLASFSIDPKNDTVERLKWYTEKIGADDQVWNFLRADRDLIDEAASSFKVYQEEDPNAQGGFNHQSRFILLDKNGTVRGYYDGVNPDEVSKMIADMKSLF